MDTTAHRVVRDGTQLKELVSRSGGDWGSTYIDNGFKVLLIKTFGADLIATYKLNYAEEFEEVVKS